MNKDIEQDQPVNRLSQFLHEQALAAKKREDEQDKVGLDDSSDDLSQ